MNYKQKLPRWFLLKRLHIQSNLPFFSGGDELLYIVQSLKTDDLFIEHVSLDGGKVIKRYRFKELEEITPSAISVHSNGKIWAVGDTDGRVMFLDPESEKMIFQKSVSSFGIVDIVFSGDGKQLFVIDETGKITSWVIEK